MKTLRKAGAGWLALAIAATGFLVALGPSRADEYDKAKEAGAVTTLWSMGKESGAVLLLAPGQSKPTAFTVTADTVLGGICLDCQLHQTFRASEPTKKCNTCACGSPNVECIAWKPVKPATWEQMLQKLPRGVTLRVAYKTADKPESGLKSLIVDRRTVLMPVEGLSGETPEQLLTLVKPFGGVKASLTEGGKQLLIDLKESWTTERETKFEKALAKVGAKIAFDDTVTAAR